MVIIGIILVIAALLVGLGLIMGATGPQVSGQDVELRLFDSVTISVTPLALIILGMATMLVLWVGLVLIRTTLSRKAKQRRDRKEREAREKELARERQTQQEHEQRAREEQEREQLARQASAERPDSAGSRDQGPPRS